MLKIKKISETIGKDAYVDTGDFLGQVEGVTLSENKIDGWRIKVSGAMGQLIGGARGIIVPHQFIKAVGDVFIINRASLPFKEEQDLELEEQE